MSGSETSPSQDSVACKPPVLSTSERRRLKKRLSDQGMANQKMVKLSKSKRHGNSSSARRLALSESSSDLGDERSSVSDVINEPPHKSPKKTPKKVSPKKVNQMMEAESSSASNYVIPKVKQDPCLYLARVKEFQNILAQRAQFARIMSVSEALAKGLFKGDTKDVMDVSSVQSLKNAKFQQKLEAWNVETTAIINEGIAFWQVVEANNIEFFFDTLASNRTSYPNLYNSAKSLYEPEAW